MATDSSILAWKIPWMEEPGRLQSTGSQRVRHELSDFTMNNNAVNISVQFFCLNTCFQKSGIVIW